MGRNRFLVILTASALLASLLSGCQPAKRPGDNPTQDQYRQEGVADGLPERGDTIPNDGTIQQPNGNAGEMTPGVDPGANNAADLWPADMDARNQLADQIADKAKTVNGVERVVVVLTGNTAVVGIDLADNITGEQADAVKKEVADTLLVGEPSVPHVRVSTDPDIMSRMDEIYNGVRTDRPFTEFANQIQDIYNRINPIAQ